MMHFIKKSVPIQAKRRFLQLRFTYTQHFKEQNKYRLPLCLSYSCHTLSPSIVASLKAECSPVDDEMAKAAASPQHYKYTLVEELSHGFQSSPSLAKRQEGG